MKIKIVLSCFLLLCVTVPGLTQLMEDEYTMKSVFFAGLSRFVTWPENSRIEDKSKPFIIGVIGENPFGKILDNVYIEQKRKINDKRVETRYISELGNIPGCHILFISSSCKNYLSDILAITGDKPILTIGDTKGYAEKGVLINLFIEQRKIRFEINEAVFHKAQLRVDSLLLRAAKIVNSD